MGLPIRVRDEKIVLRKHKISDKVPGGAVSNEGYTESFLGHEILMFLCGTAAFPVVNIFQELPLYISSCVLLQDILRDNIIEH